MFGSIYANHPEILIDSFKQMNDDYQEKIEAGKGCLHSCSGFLGKLYLRILGIPEIGFQVRFLYFKKILNECLFNFTPKKILDAGSGIGAFAFWLGRFYPRATVVGYEIDKNKLQFCQELAKELQAKNVTFLYNDLLKKNRERKVYDLIVNIDVLEHVKNYKKVLKNCYDLLKPYGYLYIHTPQPNQRRVFKQFTKWHHKDHTYEGFSPIYLRKRLEKLGFKVIVLRQTFGFLGSLAWEINHIMLFKGFILAGLTYPLLYLLARLDLLFINKKGLGIVLLAQKR